MIYAVIIIFLFVTVLYFKDNNKYFKQQINKLHLENESYLNLLMQENLIPEKLGIEKINSMNKNYGEVKIVTK